MLLRRILGLVLALAASAALAQQIYRWTDEKGRVHLTDTPPPPSAKDIQTHKPAGTGAVEPVTPFTLAQAMKDYPVTLYTAPICKDPCAQARAALNRRGVPFKEVQVWEDKTNEELKNLSGGNEVPTLVVGRSVQKGFAQSAYDSLLDSARYPREGLLPARTQAAPPLPEGYVPPGEREALPKAEPVKPEPVEEQGTGPYSPGAPPQRAPKK
jgi:glutaredoxin